MQKEVGIYLIILVVGAIIGASAVILVASNQNPNIHEQVKVTIQGLKYEPSDSKLKIELLNDSPERNLDGNVAIYQSNKQWTSEVVWYYTGFGEAAILCNTINENQSFRITYTEKNPQVTLLDRTIEWYEVELPELTIGFMETKELTITQMTFDTASNRITVHITNSGTSDVTVGLVKINGNTLNMGTDVSGIITYEAGDTGILTIDCNIGVVAGNKYAVNIFTSDGTMVGSYMDTA